MNNSVHEQFSKLDFYFRTALFSLILASDWYSLVMSAYTICICIVYMYMKYMILESRF